MEIMTSVPTGVGNPPILPSSKSQPILTEVPGSLKTLARLVVRGFHSVEDQLIIDMLVRYPCMREDDISALLKFDKKILRSRMAILKNDKFVQVDSKSGNSLAEANQTLLCLKIESPIVRASTYKR